MESDGSCEGLASTIQAKIQKSSPQFSSTKSCIYRVPLQLRQHNKKAYTPLVVSIGPFHHNDHQLLPMEAHKLCYLQSFLNRSPQNMNLSSYLRILKEMETDIRRCYAEPIHLSSDAFIQMVLVDSAFLIELFWRYSNPSLIREDDYIYQQDCIKNMVERDIKLEENQLPFSVLIWLYTTAFKSGANMDQVPCFTDLVVDFLKINKSKIGIDATTKEASCLHLLDLLRCHYKPDYQRSNGDNGQDHVSININSPVCPTATSLYAAGVQFKAIDPVDDNSSNLLDICFDKEKGILSIPKLTVEDGTEDLFRNLVAFEQCRFSMVDYYFTDYRYFLDCLINTPKDVNLLAKAGIIENMLGSHNQVSDLINSLGNDVMITSNDYNYMGITQQLVDHHNKRWNSYRALLKQKYFAHPWAIISVIYAAILLLFTTIQVVAGILAIPHVLRGT